MFLRVHHRMPTPLGAVWRTADSMFWRRLSRK
jgi:hypothetical protein